MKFIFLCLRFSIIFLCIVESVSVCAQTTPIPDAAFEQYLVNQGYDSNGVNGNILLTDAAAVTVLDITTDMITDFTGLDAFINLEEFYSGNTQFTTLPLNTQTSLRFLYIEGNNALASLNVSNLTSLEDLRINNTMASLPSITSLDLSQNTNLKYLQVRQILALTSITFPDDGSLLEEIFFQRLTLDNVDLSKMDFLEKFLFFGNSNSNATVTLPDEKLTLEVIVIHEILLDTFDVSDYLNLRRLELVFSQVENLSLPATNTLTILNVIVHRISDIPFSLALVPNLRELGIEASLTGLNFAVDISQNPLIEELRLGSNNMQSLDITQNPLIKTLKLDFNELTDNSIIQQYYDYRINDGLIDAGRRLTINDNDFSGSIPNFNNLVYNNGENDNTYAFRFEFQNNKFEFGDFEEDHFGYVDRASIAWPNAPFLPPFAVYAYAAQQRVNDEITITENAGNDVTLLCEVSGSQNHYRWFRNDIELVDAPDSPELVLQDINGCDEGVYYTLVTSDLVPFENTDLPGTGGKNLELRRNNVTLTVIDDAPECSILSNPINGEINVPVNTGITWTDSRGACGYVISVGTTPGGVDIVDNEDVGDIQTYNFVDNLPPNTEIFVTITPYYSNGSTSVCPEESFTTGGQTSSSGCPAFSNPLDGAVNVLVETDFVWEAGNGADGYIVQVGTTPGGTDIINTDVGNNLSYNPPVDLPENTILYATLTPYNDAANTETCTEITFTTEQFLPDCVVLTSPVDGTTGVLVGTDISWSTASTADGYILSVGTNSGSSNLFGPIDVGNVTTYDLPEDLPDSSEIFVTIIPYNGGGERYGCDQQSFFTELLVSDCTMLVNPLNGTTGVPVTTNLSWEPVDDAEGYLLTVGTASGSSDILDNVVVGNVTTYDLPTDLPGLTQIFVTITAFNALGTAQNCEEESFTTAESAPICVTLIDPFDGQTGVPIDTDLNWSISPSANSYLLSVGTSSGATDILNAENVGNVTTYDLTENLPYETEIFVTITPFNETSATSGCIEESFVTESFTPACVTITTPMDGDINVSIGTDISWTSSNNAEGYFLSVGTSSGGTEIIADLDVGNVTTYDLPDNLPVGTLIYVNIFPYNQNGITDTCEEASFTTTDFPLVCTPVVMPQPGSFDVLLDSEISWDPVPGATGYLLSIGTTPNGIDILDTEDVGNTTVYTPENLFPEVTEIFVTIVPYNDEENAVGCTSQSFTTVMSPPDCSLISLVVPENGSEEVPLDTVISWTPVNDADGYIVSAGTSSGGTDIIDAINVQNGTEIQLTEILPQGSTIYITITPYNTGGLSPACNEQSFTTEINPFEGIGNQKFGFSPDGDSINEFWKIDGIENYPDNVVSIYNRWGEIVFEIADYDNVTNVFRGSANKSTGRGAGELPEGTYFFTIDIPTGNNLPKTGYVVLKR